LRFLSLAERGWGKNRGVIHENVETPEALFDLFEKAIDFTDARQLGSNAGRFPAAADDFGGDSFGLGPRTAIVDDYASALGGQAQSNGAADAAPRARNQSDLSRKLHGEPECNTEWSGQSQAPGEVGDRLGEPTELDALQSGRSD